MTIALRKMLTEKNRDKKSTKKMQMEKKSQKKIKKLLYQSLSIFFFHLRTPKPIIILLDCTTHITFNFFRS